MDEVNSELSDERGYRGPISGRRDRWLLRLPAISFVAWFLLVLWAGIPGPLNLLAIPIVVLGGPAAALILLLLSGHLMLKRKLRKAVSIALIAILPPLLWQQIFWASECAHLPLTVWLGVGQIGSPSISQNTGFSTYDWSVGLVTNPDTFLIYDPTDEISLPANKHKHPLVSENGFGEECAGKVTHLVGHFYECTF